MYGTRPGLRAADKPARLSRASPARSAGCLSFCFNAAVLAAAIGILTGGQDLSRPRHRLCRQHYRQGLVAAQDQPGAALRRLTGRG